MKLRSTLILFILLFAAKGGNSQQISNSAQPYLDSLKTQDFQHYLLVKTAEDQRDTFEIALFEAGVKSKVEQRRFLVLNNKEAIIHLDTLSAYYRPKSGYLYSRDLKVPDAAYAWSDFVFPPWGVEEAEPRVYEHQWDSTKSWVSNGFYHLYLKRDTLTMPGAAGAEFEFEYTLVFDVESKQAQKLIIKTKGDMSPVFQVSYEVLSVKPGFHTVDDFENWALDKWKNLSKTHSH